MILLSRASTVSEFLIWTCEILFTWRLFFLNTSQPMKLSVILRRTFAITIKTFGLKDGQVKPPSVNLNLFQVHLLTIPLVQLGFMPCVGALLWPLTQPSASWIRHSRMRTSTWTTRSGIIFMGPLLARLSCLWMVSSFGTREPRSRRGEKVK